MSSRPLLLGHRGLRRSGLRAITSNTPVENSLEAFEYALSQGCDGFEFDVRYTRDGRNVLWHDAQFNGKDIASTEYAGLGDRDEGCLATLDDVLRQFGERAYLDIELKVAGREDGIVAALNAQSSSAWIRGVFLSARGLAEAAQSNDQIPLGYICERSDWMDRWRELPIKVFLPRHDRVQAQLVEEVHDRGLQIMTWTVNSPRHMRQLAGWGVDGLISDDPGLLFRTLGAGVTGA